MGRALSTALIAIFAPASALAAGTPVAVTAFGSNPGNLKMYEYAPVSIGSAPAPLVIALHGCGESAASFATATGWIELADANGFYLALPEQQATNNPEECFNWFLPGQIERDQGEAGSIAQMTKNMSMRHAIDSTRVFIVGFSAGAAMTSVMLATYPDLFAGGAIMSGVPYGCAIDLQSGIVCMQYGSDRTPAAWGDLVRSASTWQGPWPTVSIWHGQSDLTVNPNNAISIRAQWTNVHGLGETPSSTTMLQGASYSAWRDGQGNIKVELYQLPDFPHAVAVIPGICGTTDPPGRSAGICAAALVASAWGIVTHAPLDAGASGEIDAAEVSADAGSDLGADAGSANPKVMPAKSGSCACVRDEAHSARAMTMLLLAAIAISRRSRLKGRW